MNKTEERRGFAGHALVQLILVRFREFWREPEALFWVFGFPILLAAGLGVAFRNRPAEVLPVGATTADLARAMRPEKGLTVKQLSPAAAEEALRTGKLALLAEPGPNGTVVYRFDDTNPEGRAARQLADTAIQRGAGRTDPVRGEDRLVREPGLALHRFPDPRPAGHEPDGQRHLGHGLRHRGRADARNS